MKKADVEANSICNGGLLPTSITENGETYNILAINSITNTKAEDGEPQTIFQVDTQKGPVTLVLQNGEFYIK